MAEQPYGFSPAFEQAVAVLCSRNIDFCGRVGFILRPDLFALKPAQWVLRAVLSIVKDTGQGPGSDVLTLERLRSFMRSGVLPTNELEDIEDMLLDTLTPDAEGVATELVPVVKRRVEAETLHSMVNAYSNRDSLASGIEQLQALEKLGASRSDLGLQLTGASLAQVDTFARNDKLRTPVTELTTLLEGGLPRGAGGLVIGGTSEGKSQFGADQAGIAWQLGYFVMYATLELPSKELQMRCIAGATGIPTNSVYGALKDEAQKRLEEVLPTAGHLVFQKFEHGTTWPQLKAWIRNGEQRFGRKVDLFILDYVQLMGAHKREDLGSTNSTQGTAMMCMRDYAEEHLMWLWVLSQRKRLDRKFRGQKAQGEDIGESIKVLQGANIAIVLNPDPKNKSSMTLWVDKNSFGECGVDIGPFQTDFACGRFEFKPETMPVGDEGF